MSALGIESDRPVKISDGSIIVAFVCISDAPGAQGESIVGIELNRLVVISDGSVVGAYVRISIAPVPKGETAFGIEPDRLVKIGDGPVIVAGVGICIAFADQGRVARTRLGFGSFAVIFRRSNSLLLSFLTFALNFCLSRRLAFLPCLKKRLPLLFGFLTLALSFRLGLRSSIALRSLLRPRRPH